MAKVTETFTMRNMKVHGQILSAEWEDNSFISKDKAGNIIKNPDGTPKMVEVKSMKLRIFTGEDVVELYDKQSNAIQTYQRGQEGTFTLRLDYKPTFGAGNYEATMLIIGFAEDRQAQPRRVAAPATTE